MLKRLIVLTLSAPFIFILLFGGVSSARANSCLIFANDFGIGSSSNDVTSIQAYLQGQGYLNYSATGYFGPLTLSAVQNFQRAHGISATGFIGPLTRALLASISCSNSPTPIPIPGCTPTTLYSTVTGQRCNQNNPIINYISPNAGQAGTPIIIYGSGFTSSGNAIRFDNSTVLTVSSADGHTINFTLPAGFSPDCSTDICPAIAAVLGPGNYAVSVVNANGTSNSVNFSVGGSVLPCVYGQNCGGNSSAPQLTSLNPSIGSVGSSVTITGNGFTPSGNTVNINGGILVSNLSSNESTLTFTIPFTYSSQLQCHGTTCTSITTNLNTGTYPLTVVNSNGTSNALNFTVTSTSNAGNTPSISAVTGPSTLTVGQTGTFTVSAIDPQNSTLFYAANWGDVSSNQCPPGYIVQTSTYGGYTCIYAPNGLGNVQLSNIFTHSYSKAGTYNVTFTVSNLSALKATFSKTIVVGTSNSSGPVTISYLSPSSGRVGTSATIHGSGFTPTANKINFSGGEYYNISNINSSDGSTLIFTVPAYTDYACLHTIPACYIAQQLTTIGTHSVSVTNANGTSNSQNFTVTY